MNDYFPELDGNQSIDNGKMGRILAKGGSPQQQTTTSEIDPMLKPYITKGLDEASRLYDEGAPAYYPDETYVPAGATTTTALDAARARATAGSPLLPAAQAEQLSTIRGDRLSAANPYFTAMMDSASKPVISQFNEAIRGIGTRASQAGRYGSDAMFDMEDKARDNLANALTGKGAELAYQNFASERARQDAAISGAPSLAAADYSDIGQLAKVGATEEDYARQKLQSDIGRFEYRANAPQKQLSSFLSAAYGAPTPMTTTTTSSGGGK